MTTTTRFSSRVLAVVLALALLLPFLRASHAHEQSASPDTCAACALQHTPVAVGTLGAVGVPMTRALPLRLAPAASHRSADTIVAAVRGPPPTRQRIQA